ncbi:MAG: ABC transporter ATP-binding protein [Myxococcales bacterium]|nr:ABC transporter ATP-binding protein [Myxococcales bacterium]
MSGATNPAVEVRALTMAYREVLAVRDVSFQVSYGEIFGLLGPNGAGKTTTLRILATLLRASRGSARVAGIDVADDPLSVRARVGYLTGDTGLYGRLTPRELLDYFAELHRVPRAIGIERRERLVRDLEIGEFADRRCETLSTGQKQRVNIARTLIHDPEILIVDEPTTGLDIISAQFILRFLRGERERGKAVILSTHIMTEAELLCDRIALLFEGEILAEGTLAELLSLSQRDNLTHAFLWFIDREA